MVEQRFTRGRAALGAGLRRRPSGRRDWLRLAAWGIAIFGVAAPIIRLTVGYDAIGFPVTLIAALVALLWVTPRRYELRTWVTYLVAIYFFTQLRDAADETALKASTGYVLDWERWMFNGDTPSAWLQEHIGGAQGNPNALTYLSVLVHWTWFIFPHAVVLGTFFVARELFFRVACIVAGTFFFGVALYYLVPTVPPWLAAQEGATSGVTRIMEDVGPTLLGQSLWDDLFAVFSEPNPRAAMPSVHFAVSGVLVVVAVVLRSRRLLVGSVTYSILLAFSLIYLGEHYFADILAGGAAAIAAVFIVETALGNGPGVRAKDSLVRQGRRLWAGRLPRPRLPAPPGGQAKRTFEG